MLNSPKAVKEKYFSLIYRYTPKKSSVTTRDGQYGFTISIADRVGHDC